MARQVYFDPFGSYVGGYDKGVQTEQNLQSNIRQARDNDFNYYNIKPLELNRLQRDDAVGQAAQPYRLMLPRIGYDNAVAERFRNQIGVGQTAAQYGLTEPTAQALGNYTGRGYVMDPQGGIQFVDTMGGAYGPQMDINTVLQADPTFRAEGRGVDKENWDRQYQTGALGVSAYNADTARAAAEANANIGYGNNIIDQLKAYGGTGGAAGQPQTWFAPTDPLTVQIFGGGGGTQPQPGYAGTPAVQAPTQQGQLPQAYAPSPRGPQPLVKPKNLTELVTWMRAANPNAPALTEQELLAMDPAQQNAYVQQYFPQLLQTAPAPAGGP